LAGRKARRRCVLFGVAVGVAALVVVASAWLALATPLFQKIGSGLMFKSPGDGPLVTYGEPGTPAEAVVWHTMGSTTLEVREVSRDYLVDDGTQAQAAIAVAEDADRRPPMSRISMPTSSCCGAVPRREPPLLFATPSLY